jgi:hypothetical protein
MFVDANTYTCTRKQHTHQPVQVSACIDQGAFQNLQKLSDIHALAVREDQTFVTLDRLRTSMSTMSVRVQRSDHAMWLEGLELCESQVQDHALLIEFVREGPFAELAARDMQDIALTNKEAEGLVSKLR